MKISHYDCSVIGELGTCNGGISIWDFTHNGEQIAFYESQQNKTFKVNPHAPASMAPPGMKVSKTRLSK